MRETTDISVIIVNYNTLHVLQPCLDSIAAHTAGVSYEIIVVDNASTDGTAEALANDPRIRFVESGQNLGFGRANNLGLRYANGEYVLFLNSDTLLRNNAIKMLYDFARQYKGRLGALGTVLEDRAGNPIHSYGPFPRMRDDWRKLVVSPLKKALGIHREPPVALPGDWMRVDYVTGADLFVSHAVLEDCGSFDPAFFLYCEETEMEHRFVRHGYENVIMRGPRIVHLEGESSNDGKTSKFIRDCLRQQKSQYIYFKLTHPRWQYYAYRVIHPVLRQTLWLNPRVSLSDKLALMRQLFIRTGI